MSRSESGESVVQLRSLKGVLRGRRWQTNIDHVEFHLFT